MPGNPVISQVCILNLWGLATKRKKRTPPNKRKEDAAQALENLLHFKVRDFYCVPFLLNLYSIYFPFSSLALSFSYKL